MGDIGQGMGKMFFFLFQVIILLTDTQGHFADFGLQDGKLAFLVGLDRQMAAIRRYLVLVKQKKQMPQAAAKISTRTAAAGEMASPMRAAAPLMARKRMVKC